MGGTPFSGIYYCAGGTPNAHFLLRPPERFAAHAFPPSSTTLKPSNSPRSCMDFMWSP